MERGVTVLMPKMSAMCPRVGALCFLVRLGGGAGFATSCSHSTSWADVGDVKMNLNAWEMSVGLVFSMTVYTHLHKNGTAQKAFCNICWVTLCMRI